MKTQAFLAKTVETGDETACFIVCSLFVKNSTSCEGLRLIRSSHLQRWQSFSERLIQSTNDNACKPAKWAKFMLVLTRWQISHYEFVLQKHCDYWLENQSLILRSVPQMLKKWRIVVNKISKVRQTTCNWIKKILDGATRIVNVFLISWFFYLFLCSISLLVKYAFILWYEAWVNL